MKEILQASYVSVIVVWPILNERLSSWPRHQGVSAVCGLVSDKSNELMSQMN